MNRKLFIMMCFLLIVFSAGCSNEDEDSNLYNTWILVSYGNESNEVLKEAKGYFYQITFNSDGTYSGLVDGVYYGQSDESIVYGNRLSGRYVCIGNTIKIIDGDVTQRGVEGADPDRFFFTHLREIYTYKISASELWLYYSKDEYFKFRIKKGGK